MASKKKGQAVDIGSINARENSSNALRQDDDTSQIQAQMDARQVRLGSLEGLLNVRGVGNPLLQRALDQRRHALGMGKPTP